MAPLFGFLARPLGRFGDAIASLLILLTAGLTIGGVAFDLKDIPFSGSIIWPGPDNGKGTPGAGL